MKSIALIALSLLLSACATAPTVQSDFDASAPFSSYRTFRWLQTPQGVSPLQHQRIVEGVNRQLIARGWIESAGTADIAIAAHVSTEQRQDIDTFYSAPTYVGWGWRGPWPVGTATTSVRTYDVGTLVVDLFDEKTRQAVWRGSARGTIPSSPERLNEGVQSGIEGMFARLPDGSQATP